MEWWNSLLGFLGRMPSDSYAIAIVVLLVALFLWFSDKREKANNTMHAKHSADVKAIITENNKQIDTNVKSFNDTMTDLVVTNRQLVEEFREDVKGIVMRLDAAVDKAVSANEAQHKDLFNLIRREQDKGEM